MNSIKFHGFYAFREIVKMTHIGAKHLKYRQAEVSHGHLVTRITSCRVQVLKEYETVYCCKEITNDVLEKSASGTDFWKAVDYNVNPTCQILGKIFEFSL